MKKYCFSALFLVTFFAALTLNASAVTNGTVKVGLYFGSSALYSANLENDLGGGFAFGWYDGQRDFVSLGETDETQISMTVSGTIYMNESGTYSSAMPSGGHRLLGSWHAQLDGYGSFDEAADAAADLGGYPAWINGDYVVRVGAYGSRAEAESLGAGDAVQSSSDGVLVTVTKTDRILFEFEDGDKNLGIQPEGWRGESATWFRNRRYAGGFEYVRYNDGLNVVNVVDLEDYVKGVVPYEMNGDWPEEALAAQAVCARTFACGNTKHLSLYGFDVCNGNDCQVYYGLGSGSGVSPTEASNRAVEATAGECLYYQGSMVRDALYHSSNGGATESSENVYGGKLGYLTGKLDPYEGQTSIPSYHWTVTYTADQLTWILEQKGYDIGTVKDVYVSAYTPTGNVAKVTFEGSKKDVTVSGITCSSIFYSSTYNKSVRSLRFDINGSSAGQSGGGAYVNDSGTYLSTLEGASVLSGKGVRGTLSGDVSVLSSAGTSVIPGGSEGSKGSGAKDGTFTITGSGSGHNVGMSQYGAKAMAEKGFGYRDILEFYYTGVTIE